MSEPGRPSEDIKIYRDNLGIPHIRAKSAYGAFFAQGFVHAKDRFWQMDYDRMRAQGRFSEYAGPAPLAQDMIARRIGLYSTSLSDYEKLRQDTREILQAYCDGVNYYLANASEPSYEHGLLGATPEPWHPWDGLAIYKIRHVMMGVWEGKIWRHNLMKHIGPERLQSLYPGATAGELLILPPSGINQGTALDRLSEFVSEFLSEFLSDYGKSDLAKDDDGGSNNWVADGSRTKSGKPLMAGDPHRAIDVPNVYYQNHLACDLFDVVGLSFLGLPGFPHFGHNDRVAWCITHTGADTQDLFVEEFRSLPDGSLEYLYKEEWKPCSVSREQIRVRGQEPVTVEVVNTIHGPVMLGDARTGKAMVLRYTATLGDNRGADCLLPIMLARDVDQLEQVMRQWVDPVNNLLYAGIDGQIGYRTRGHIPVRHGLNGWLPVPGATGKHDWQKMIPFEEMPAVRNPDAGFVCTANNRVVASDYPHYIALTFALDNRARRIEEVLRDGHSLTVEDMSRIHADTVSRPALDFLKVLPMFAPQSDLARRALDIVRVWDGRMDADSPAAAIYTQIREELVALVLKPLFGPVAPEAYETTGRGGPVLIAQVRGKIFGLILSGDTSLLPPGETLTGGTGLLNRALSSACDYLARAMGSDPAAWQWGKIHRLRPVHPLAAVFPDKAGVLNPPSVPVPGDGDTVRAGSYVPVTGYTVTGSSVARYVFDLGNWDNSAWIVPHGSSGDPRSPHYTDQLDAWLRCELVPMTYNWDKIQAEAVSCQVL